MLLLHLPQSHQPLTQLLHRKPILFLSLRPQHPQFLPQILHAVGLQEPRRKRRRRLRAHAPHLLPENGLRQGARAADHPRTTLPQLGLGHFPHALTNGLQVDGGRFSRSGGIALLPAVVDFLERDLLVLLRRVAGRRRSGPGAVLAEIFSDRVSERLSGARVWGRGRGLFDTLPDVSEEGREGRVGVGVRIGIGSGEEEDARGGCASTIQTEKNGHGGRLQQRGLSLGF